jgi:hypothetical protein
MPDSVLHPAPASTTVLRRRISWSSASITYSA